MKIEKRVCDRSQIQHELCLLGFSKGNLKKVMNMYSLQVIAQECPDLSYVIVRRWGDGYLILTIDWLAEEKGERDDLSLL